MKCKCSGTLIRVTIDCYQCKQCGTKQKMAYLDPTIPQIDISPIDPSVNTQPSIDIQTHSEYIQKEICNALKVPSHMISDARKE
jgi:hypothetical protein